MKPSKTILIVDDSEFDRNLLAGALSRKTDYTIFQANGSDQCLEIIQSQKVDLILMDIMMPGTFGTQVLKIIREKFNAIELPIIMITAKADATDVVGSLQLGANDYITKPVNFDVAISRISTHLKLAEVSQEMGRFKEMAALDAMIAAYNHEINNALTVAIGYLHPGDLNQNREKLSTSLWRLADIVKKIKSLSEKKEIEYQPYAGQNKMVKLNE